MTEPADLQVDNLALVNGPLVRVVELTSLDGTAGAIVRDDAGYETWVPIRWLLPVPVDKGK